MTEVHPRLVDTRERTAFTLVELLVVIGIIALLISILLPTINRARAAAQQVKLSAAMREMLLGYTQYHIDHLGRLPYGFAPEKINGIDLLVSDPATGHTYGGLVAQRFPWRIAPWFSGVWGIMHIDKKTVPPLPTASDSASAAYWKAYKISLRPAISINAVYVGGSAHNIDGTPSDNAFNANGYPITDRHVVFRASEVRRPTELIVFTEVTAKNSTEANDELGAEMVAPPRANGHHWHVENGKIVSDHTAFMGVPQGRFNNKAVVGFFDGHAQAMSPAELDDMRLWCNVATTPDYDYVP